MSMLIAGKHYGWTQPVCSADWHKRNPDREPIRIRPEFCEQEICCYCGQPTTSGIYVRIDPREVSYPTEEQD